MIKKILVTLMIAVSITCIVISGKFAKESGMFEPFPDAEYLNVDDLEIRPVYQQLSKKEQSVYSALYNGIKNKQTKIPLPCEVSGDTYSKIYCLLEKEEGELFYMDSTYYTAEKVRNAQVVFREDVNNIDSKISELDNILESISSNAPYGDYEKALYIHNYITRVCTYDAGSDDSYCSTAYGCLVEGRANCEGYAKAFGCLASRMGMKSILVTGKTHKGENHAWNQVFIDGKWYNIDVTWDDTDQSDYTRWAYFLCKDEEFGNTHIADNDYFKPFACVSEENNYYIKNNIFAHNSIEAEDIIRNEINCGKNIIGIKFSDITAYNNFKTEYIDGQKIFDVILDSGYFTGNSLSLTTREIEDEYCITIDFS